MGGKKENSSLFTTSSHHSWGIQRTIPFLRCPGGLPSPTVPTPIPCRFEYTSSSDWLWSL